ncbi:MAG: riboflavin synthase [Candidatus Moraniibacteriota bacterium]|jgi:riboflavin synthase
MFTGIITKISTVESAEERGGSFFVAIKKPKGWRVKLGESISVNGVCSTVKSVAKNSFEVEYMPETLKKTTTGNFAKGRAVNLEKSLTLSQLLDGHIVQGHIDARGKIIEIKNVKKSKVMKIQAPKKVLALIVEKGSVSVDGISLTVVETKKDWFSISLVEYTLLNTNLGTIEKGTEVNIETDILAKYIYKFLNK